MTTTNYRLEILTPTHVGSGDSYVWLDYVYEGGKLYVLDIGRVSQALTRSGVISVGELVERMKDATFSWNRLLQQAGVAVASVAEYAIPAAGDPAVGSTGRRGERAGEVRAIARNANRQPYIPGSSIKGAIRSAVVARLLLGVSNNELGGKVGRGRKEFAAGQLEQTLLGRDPNHDLFRALQVSDSDPFALDDVRVVEVRRGRNFDGTGGMLTFVEVLRAGAATVVKLRVDDGLLEAHFRTLGWSSQQVAILRDELAAACREFSATVVQEQRKFYRPNWQESEDAASFSLLLGWGGGWAGKAPIGVRLKGQMPDFFEQTANYLQMGKREVVISADTFPTSHWMAREGSQELPLGWVRLTPTDAVVALPRLQPVQVRDVEVKLLPRAVVQQSLPPRGDRRDAPVRSNQFVPAERPQRQGGAQRITSEAEIVRGRLVVGTVVEVKPNMVRVELYPTMVKVLHVSHYADPSDFHPEQYKLGDEVTLKVIQDNSKQPKLGPVHGSIDD